MKQQIILWISSLKGIFYKFNNLIKNNTTISALLVFGFFLISFLLIYMKLPVLAASDDHYFHFRFAERLLQNGFFDSFRHFQTIYFTNVASGVHFLYYNFLFYAVLIPFTFFVPLFLGIKLFAVFSVSLIGVIIFLFIKNIGIKFPFLWTIGFFSAIGMGSFWRLFLSRPFVLSPLIILLLILIIHKKKYFWIFFLSFICLFWHTATFLVPIGASVIYFLCYFFYQKKFLWKELLLVFLGTIFSVIAASIIDTGFFIHIRDNLFSVLASVFNFGSKKVNIGEGMEVYPRNFFDLFNQNIFLCTMFIVSIVFYVFNFVKEIREIITLDKFKKTRKILSMVFFVFSCIFLVAIPIVSNRFTDFFIFFAWIFIALVFSEIFSYIEFKKVNIKKFVGIAVIVCLCYLFLNNGLQLNDNFAASGSRPETFAPIGNYLSKNLGKGEIIFDVNWSWFAQLYYYAPEQNYVIGIEPKLTYLYDPRLYWTWVNIGNGYVCEEEKCKDEISERDHNFTKEVLFLKWSKNEGNKIYTKVVNDFKSHYIVSSSQYPYLNNVLDNNKHFKKVVDSNNYYLYKLVE